MKLKQKNYPIRSGIVISWVYGQEFIDLDFNNLQGLGKIASTLEWWPDERCFASYHTDSTVTHLPTGGVEITLTYTHQRNPSFGKDELWWGKSTFTIGAKDTTGSVHWVDATDSSRDGAFPWERVSRELTESVSRRVVSRIERDQQIFRSALLIVDTRCVLSGEATPDAVEAAHIVPAWDGGAAIKENGFLLRKDLHALYDKEYFEITPSGQVVVLRNELSQEYRDLLSGKQLPEATLARVHQALKRASQKTRQPNC